MKKIENIVFMGTPDFASGILEAILKAGYHVSAVFTQPDKPVGRKAVLTPPPVKETAQAAGIPVYQPDRLRRDENVELLRTIAPDVIVVAAFGQLLPESILSLPVYGCINVHASLLPAWRGSAPIQWAIINGDSESGVTTMQMDAGLDTGDMLEKVAVPIAPDETGGSLFDKLQNAGADLLLQTLENLQAGTLHPEPQPEESTTPYAAMLNKKTGKIDWTKGAAEIERLIRGLDPWPCAYTSLQGKQLKLWSACVKEAPGTASVQPGTVTAVTKDAVEIQTGRDILVLKQVQLEGKKRMDVSAFLRGFHVEAGMVLGQQE